MKHRLFTLLLMLSLLLCLTACTSSDSNSPASQGTTVPTATIAPATEAPATAVPATQVPATAVPTTQAPPTAVPVTQAPPEDKTYISGDYAYKLDGAGNAVAVQYTQEQSSGLVYLEIPAELDGHKVVELANFKNSMLRKKLRSVIVPEGVERIGDRAFMNCRELEQVILPTTLTEIGAAAFSGTAVQTVTAPAVVTIGESAFEGCESLRGFTLPETVRSIGDFAFADTGLTITLPDSVEILGARPFDAFTINPDHPNFEFDGQGLYSKADQRLIYCKPQSRQYAIKEGTRIIGAEAFLYSSLNTEVIIPDSVFSIETEALANCGDLETLHIPASVTQIGTAAFSTTGKLKFIDVAPGSAAEQFCIDKKLAYRLDGDTAIIVDGVRRYISGAFEYTLNDAGEAVILKYTDSVGGSVILPEELDGHPVTTLANASLSGASASGSAGLLVIIPDCVTILEGNPFPNAVSIAELRISDNHPTLKVVGKALYSRQDQRLIFCPYAAVNATNGFYPDGKVPEDAGSFTVPEGTRRIESNAFRSCYQRLERLQLPDTLESIGDNAFYGCRNLTAVSIRGSGVTIGAGAFDGCSKLESVYLGEGVISIGLGAFANCPNLTITLVPGSYAETYCQQNNLHYQYEGAQ